MFCKLICRLMFVVPIAVCCAAAAEVATRQPTDEQRADLKMAVEKPGTPADDRLARALLVAENEGLALLAVRTARRVHEKGQRGNPRNNLLYFLGSRSGRDKLNIDGPYLKEYAELLLEIVEAELADTAGWGVRTNWRPLIVYLGAHPEDRALRERGRKLALPLARSATAYRIDDSVDFSVSTAASHRAVNQFNFAVAVFLQLKLLQEDMPLAEAKQLLGEPAFEQEDRVGWGIRTGFRRSNGLRAEMADGKCVKFTPL